jgi:peroxiredoxin
LESLNIGQEAPDFKAQTIEGEDLSLSDLRGQFVLLEFWATWCGPCLPEIPHLKTMQEKYQDSDFKIVGISLDRDKDTLRNFLEEREMEWAQIFVDEGWEGDIARQYNVSGIPRMYFIDPEGRIIARDLRGEEMVSVIEEIVDKYSD